MIELERPITDWLPTTREEVEKRGWDQVDVILISGDAYVDHPSFGAAVIGRVIESAGFSVAIIAQPNWRDDLRDFKKLGKPRLFFGVSTGCMDSMVNHYTAARRRRSDDAYTPGGKAGFRPDYAADTYCSILKQLYPDVPVVLGGIEGSLRRFTHYDYWSDNLKPSIIVSSKADLLIYGMGEQPVRELLRLLDQGVPFEKIRNLSQTAYLLADRGVYSSQEGWNDVELISHEICLKEKRAQAKNFRIIEEQSNRMVADRILQPIGQGLVVVNPPYSTQTTEEIDKTYDLPYTRLPHPKYKKRGEVPAWRMIRNSVNTHRGCFGGCAFCTISAHQGKFVVSRSEESVLRELNEITKVPGFDGIITDLGGPSANMYKMKGVDQKICVKCKKPSCIYPVICPNLDANHLPMVNLLKRAEAVEGIKKVYIGSGIRYDLLLGQTPDMQRKNGCNTYLNQVVTRHISGRLKVAPEHASNDVLKLMRKPGFAMFKEFKNKASAIALKNGINQQVIPYFISSHPASTIADMAALAIETKGMGYKLEQVQDFTPTPMTLATEIYYTGINPYTMEPVYTAKTLEEKDAQRRMFFWYLPENRDYIKKSLIQAGRADLLDKLYGGGKRPPSKSNPREPKAGVDRGVSSKSHNSRRKRG